MTYSQSPEIRRNCTSFPEITTAALTGPEAVGDKLVYTFTKSIGTKG
jgi:PRTRC genetic system protein C